MQSMLTRFASRDGHFRRFAALACLALFLTLQLFADSSALHRAIHHDAASPDHQCVITLLAQGQVNAVDPVPMLVAFVAATFFLLPLISSAVLSSFEYRFAPSRGPPRS